MGGSKNRLSLKYLPLYHYSIKPFFTKISIFENFFATSLNFKSQKSLIVKN